ARAPRVRRALEVQATAARRFRPNVRERRRERPRLVLARVGVHHGAARPSGGLGAYRGRYHAHLPVESGPDGAARDAGAAVRRWDERDAHLPDRAVEPGQQGDGARGHGQTGRERGGGPETDLSRRRPREQSVAAVAARPLRVALLTSAREWRGSGVSLSHIAHGLAASGHTVQLLSTTPPVTAGFAATGLPVEELPIHDTGLAEARRLTRALAALRTDVLVAETPRDVRLGALASLARRFALVYSYNVNRAVPPRDPIMRLAYRRVRLTIFRTHTGQRQVLASAPFMGRPPHRVIHEGVDGALFRPDPQAGRAFRARHGLGERPFLLAVGALEREKRYDWILDALARLGPRPPRPPLLVIRGSGSLEAAVRTQAERLGVEVQLLGFLPADELAAAYNAASCLVHVCPVETFGLTVAEAMACGRPVVAVASGALPEVVDGVGVLAPADDPAAFAEAVRALLADPARAAALGAAARDRAVDAFSMERMGREYGEALEALLR